MNGLQVMELGKHKTRSMNRKGDRVTRYLNGINVTVHRPMIGFKSMLYEPKNRAEDARSYNEVATSWSGI